MAIATLTSIHHRWPGSEISWPITLVAGTNRVLVVAVHSRGNPGQSDVSQVELGPYAPGPSIATLTPVVDTHTDGIVRCSLFELKESDFPPDGLYRVEAKTFGAFQIALNAYLFSGVDQDVVPLVGGHGVRDTQQTISLGSQEPLPPIVRDGSLLVDGTSGDNNGIASPAEPRDQYFGLVQSPLSAAFARSLVDTAESPLDFGWSYTVNMNRICMAYALYQPWTDDPEPEPDPIYRANTNILGSVA